MDYISLKRGSIDDPERCSVITNKLSNHPPLLYFSLIIFPLKIWLVHICVVTVCGRCVHSYAYVWFRAVYSPIPIIVEVANKVNCIFLSVQWALALWHPAHFVSSFGQTSSFGSVKMVLIIIQLEISDSILSLLRCKNRSVDRMNGDITSIIL